MNLLFSFGNLIRPTRGGTERVTALIAHGLQARGHKVSFLITEEVNTSPLPVGTYSCAGLSHEEKAPWVNRLCERLRIDVLINEAGTSDDIRFLNHESLQHPCRIITCIHFDITGDLQYFYRSMDIPLNSWSNLLRWMKLPFLKWMHTRNRRKRYRYLLQHSDAVVVPAPALMQQFFRFTGTHPSTRVRCIPNPAVFAPETVWSKEPMALFVGRLVPGKHVDHLLDAWSASGAERNGWNLVIVGEGDQRPNLERQAKRLRLRSVCFTGSLNRPDELYRRATLLILPSDYESFSMVVLEGLSFGCFPIVYAFPAISQLLLKPEWGMVLPQHHRKALTAAIQEAISRHLTNLPHQKDIHNHLKHFALPTILNQWEQLIAPAP